MVPTNVGDDVPEEIQPSVKIPPKVEELAQTAEEKVKEIEEKVKKCVQGEDNDCDIEAGSGAMSIVSSISVALATSLMLTLF